MLQLISYFQTRDYHITFVSTAVENKDSEYLNQIGLNIKQVVLNCDSFDGFLNRLQPVIVLFDRFLSEEQFGWRVAEQVPDALRILDTEDVHSLRHVREQCFKRNIPFSIAIWLQNDKTKRELASIYRCDVSLIISDYEMKLLTNILGTNSTLLYHLPFMVDVSEISLKTPSFEERKDFIFIGGGKHAPNIDSIKHLKHDLWPRLRKKLPKVNLNIYGAYLPQEIWSLDDKNVGFRVLGQSPNVQDVMQTARICLAPLRFGAGTKGKLLHAMQYGTPSVTTKIGAEGMYGELEWNGSITTSEIDFANAAVNLYTSKKKWAKAQKNGYNLIRSIYEKQLLQKRLDIKIANLLHNLKAHRTTNFIGSLLLHQSMASTKYMSKWIQEKNK